MKFKSHLLAQASGSVAGATYSRNKGGMYIRSRSLVITPGTVPQANAQNAMRTLSTRWQNVLTDAQREAWKVYADNVPILNALGEPRPIPALSMYVRCNSPRLQAMGATAIVDDGPTTYSVGTLTTPTVAVVGGNWSIGYDNTDEWATAGGGFLFIYISTANSPTINFFKGPFLFNTDVAGNTMTPPTSPKVVTPSPALVATNRYFLKFTASLADGRLSSPQIIGHLGA